MLVAMLISVFVGLAIVFFQIPKQETAKQLAKDISPCRCYPKDKVMVCQGPDMTGVDLRACYMPKIQRIVLLHVQTCLNFSIHAPIVDATLSPKICECVDSIHNCASYKGCIDCPKQEAAQATVVKAWQIIGSAILTVVALVLAICGLALLIRRRGRSNPAPVAIEIPVVNANYSGAEPADDNHPLMQPIPSAPVDSNNDESSCTACCSFGAIFRSH